MNAATVLVRYLENEAVRVTSGLPGEEILKFTDASLIPAFE
jgi:thiamine pyrophosphate-dependent acetolactate synthase large subunit-like protein